MKVRLVGGGTAVYPLTGQGQLRYNWAKLQWDVYYNWPQRAYGFTVLQRMFGG